MRETNWSLRKCSVPPGRRSDVHAMQMPNRCGPHSLDVLRSDLCPSEISELRLAYTLVSPGTR